MAKAGAGTGPRVRPWAIAVWLAVWEVAARAVDQPIILPTPIAAGARLMELAVTAGFWETVCLSFARIAAGFALGLAAGCAAAALAARFRRAEELLSPLMTAVKSVPVASFVVLALFWFSSRGLSTCIAFLVALPVFYTGVLQGLRTRDRQIDEVARVFAVNPARRLRYLTVPQLAPFLTSACSLAAGLCWKAGVAAELIGVPRGTVGAQLYQAKIYLETADVLAWTVTVVVLSVLCEKLLVKAVNTLVAVCVRMDGPDKGDDAGCGKAGSRTGAGGMFVCGAVKSYGATRVLEGVSLEAEPGRPLCLMGPSGAGKTTLVRAVLGLEHLDAGTVEVPPGGMAACFQEPRLAGWLTARANVQLANPRVGRGQVRAAFEALGIEGCLDRPADALSGGQARRVSLVRALVSDAPLVVLDEAFESLDADNRATALAWARGALAGRTILVVTHESADAEALGIDRIVHFGGADIKR